MEEFDYNEDQLGGLPRSARRSRASNHNNETEEAIQRHLQNTLNPGPVGRFFSMAFSAATTAAGAALAGVIGGAILRSVGWAVLNITELATIGAVAGALLAVPYYLYSAYRVNKATQQAEKFMVTVLTTTMTMNLDGNTVTGKPQQAQQQEAQLVLSVEQQEKNMHVSINKLLFKLMAIGVISGTILGPLGASMLGMTSDLQLGYATAAFGVYAGIGLLSLFVIGLIAHHFVPKVVAVKAAAQQAAMEPLQGDDLSFSHSTAPTVPNVLSSSQILNAIPTSTSTSTSTSTNNSRLDGNAVYLPQQRPV